MKRYIATLFLSAVVFSCADVLDKYPLDEITEKTYWTSVSDLELYMNQFYPELRLAEYADRDKDSDNLQPIAPSGVLHGTRSIPETGGGWGWGNIRKVNYFLEHAPAVTEGLPADLDHFMGEGYFFRAYFYFDKVKQFGDVPWYEEVLDIDSEGLMAPRTPRNEVIDHIIDDLDNAIALLQTKDAISMNRVNLEAALAFKSQVCLYEGTWEKYHAGTDFGVAGSDGTKYLQLAAEAANTLITMGTLQLYDTGHPEEDYWALFSQEDLSGNREAILVESVEPALELGTWSWTYLNGTRGKSTGLTKQLVQSYLATDGQPISISPLYKGDTTLTQTVINRDPRLSQTMWVPGQVQIATTPALVFEYPALHKGGSDLSTTGYMLRKGSTPDPEQNQGSSTDRYGKVDNMVFRYAEVLLNYAEARAELGTLTQDDLDMTINVIRDRAGMPPLSLAVGFVDPEWDFPALSPILNEIRRERRVELALEGFRYDDLMRWAAGDLIQGSRLKGARFIPEKSFPQIESQISSILVDEDRYIDRYRNLMPNGFGFNPNRDYLFPIPTNELSLNSNLEPNPGW